MSAFWMCKHGLLKILETKKMHISVQEVKFSQSIQQLVIHIDVHSVLVRTQHIGLDLGSSSNRG